MRERARGSNPARARGAALAVAALWLSCAAAGAGAAESFQPVWLPADPGKARCHIDRSGAELGNAALRYAVENDDGALKPHAFDNRYDGTAHALDGELFALALRDKTNLPASRFRLQGKLA